MNPIPYIVQFMSDFSERDSAFEALPSSPNLTSCRSSHYVNGASIASGTDEHDEYDE